MRVAPEAPRRRSPSVDQITVLRLAAAVPCDPRTARRWITGEKQVGPLMSASVARVAASLGIERLPSAVEPSTKTQIQEPA